MDSKSRYNPKIATRSQVGKDHMVVSCTYNLLTCKKDISKEIKLKVALTTNYPPHTLQILSFFQKPQKSLKRKQYLLKQHCLLPVWLIFCLDYLISLKNAS